MDCTKDDLLRRAAREDELAGQAAYDLVVMGAPEDDTEDDRARRELVMMHLRDRRTRAHRFRRFADVYDPPNS